MTMIWTPRANVTPQGTLRDPANVRDLPLTLPALQAFLDADNHPVILALEADPVDLADDDGLSDLD